MSAKKLLSLALLLMLLTPNLMAQNLTGKELARADDLNSLVESGIGLLFGAKHIEGNIEKVTVIDDVLKKISIQVEYTGFENNWLKASVIDANKATINAVQSEAEQLPEGSTKTELVLKVNGSTDDEKIESFFLKLLVSKNKDDVTGKIFVYQMRKQWKTAGLSVSSEKPNPDYIQDDLILSITPAAVGSANQLKSSNTNYLPPPRKMQKVDLDKNVYKANVVRKPMVLQSQIIKQPTAKTKETAISSDPPRPTIRNFKTIDKNYKLAEKPTSTQRGLIAKPMLIPLQLNKEQIEKGAKGPGKNAITLWDEILSDVDFDYGENNISNISTDIFPDQNENSGYYYYYPSSYNLVWDKDESYQLKILYGTGTDEQSGKVRMFAKLSPKIGTSEKRMVEELVKEYASSNKLKFEKLVPIPLAEEPIVDLAGQLSSLYAIPTKDVSAAVTGLFEPVDVAWPMDTKNADDLMVGLKEIDLNGTMQLTPQGEMPPLNIPIKISLDDKNVLGRIELTKNNWRNKDWKNEMPFPVRLKYIHALILHKDETSGAQPYIYSWSLNDTDVPVHASVKLNSSTIPNIVDSKAQRIWIEYSVPNCNSCKDDVVNSLTGGTTTSREQKIEITSYVKDDIGAHVIEVTVRSLFADPKGESIVELPSVKIKDDFETYTTSPLYVPEGKSVEYEYKIKVVTDDEIYRSEWIYSNELSIDLNKSALKTALGKYPGE